MKKITRIVCLALALVMLVPMMAACSKDSSYGAQINMYLADEVYCFDPALVFNDRSASKVVSLLFEGLVTLDDEGDLEEQLLDDYDYTEDYGVLADDPSDDTYQMVIKIKPSAWSDKRPVSADDFAYAWLRILDHEFDSDAAALLFDIKNAKAYKTTGISQSDVGISADNDRLILEFEHPIDPEVFLRKIANVAFVPLRNFDKTYYDWASTGTTFETNGPFTLRDYYPGVGMTLTRNAFYRRDVMDEDSEPAPDKYVAPYCIKVDFQLNSEEMLRDFEDGKLFYISELPMDKEIRQQYKNKAEVLDTLSSHSYIFNLNKEPFNNKVVRQVLGKVIDRNAIAEEVVFAYASTGFVPKGIGDPNGGSFADNNSAKISSSYSIADALSELSAAGINPKSYGKLTIAVKVNSVSEVNDEGELVLSKTSFDTDVVDYVVATMVAQTWNELGFNFEVVPISAEAYKGNYGLLQYRDKQHEMLYGTRKPIDVYDDTGMNVESKIEVKERMQFDVMAVDNVLSLDDPFYALSIYATNFSGSICDENFNPVGHISGFNSAAYNTLIDEAYAAKLQGNNQLLSEKLHAAEAMLLDEMPVVPIFVYQESILIHNDLSDIEFTFYGYPIFNDVDLKNWEDYLPSEE